jgi:hypothetical protein
MLARHRHWHARLWTALAIILPLILIFAFVQSRRTANIEPPVRLQAPAP